MDICPWTLSALRCEQFPENETQGKLWTSGADNPVMIK